jgi:hypothetical protein
MKKMPFLLLFIIFVYIFFWINTAHIQSKMETQTEKKEMLINTFTDARPSRIRRAANETLQSQVKHPFDLGVKMAPKQTDNNLQIGSSSHKVAETKTSSHFLSYQLHLDQPYNITYGFFTKCYTGVTTNKWGRKPIKRVPLAQPLADILKFTTTVETNMNILMLGDSVGMQFHQLLEEAAGATWDHRNLFKFAWGAHESVSIAAPIQGGGVLGAFRMTGMFLEKGKGKPPPNAGGGGWLPEDTQLLLNHTYVVDNSPPQVVHAFDSMVFRIPHGWLKLGDITSATLTESLELAHEVFGVTTAVVMTLPLNNNVVNMEELMQLHEVNAMIRDVVANWSGKGVKHVLLMDFGKWADQLTELNARLAGLNQHPANYTLERLGCTKFPPSIAMICTKPVAPKSCTCDRNMVSIDGLHWCMESIGGRATAAIACLLQCPLLLEDDEKKIKDCEKTCNHRFMSLDLLDIPALSI